MFLDRTAIAHGAILKADVCIVGGGAAGITLARTLAAGSVDVLLLEGGEAEATARSQDLYSGHMETVYRERERDGNYLSDTRLRFFGGSTNHWRGWCLPFEPLDLEARPWVSKSGWPLSYEDLDRWYPAACQAVDIPPFEADFGTSRAGARRATMTQGRIQTRIFHYSPPTRFGTKYRAELEASSSARVLLGANVLRFRADLGASGGRVKHAEVRLEDGGDITIQAKRYVVACGGIENARLLLLSDRDDPAGLGNQNDNVGRYFADHPHRAGAGEAVLTGLPGGREALDLYLERKRDAHVRSVRTRGVLVLDPDLQRAEQLLGVAVQFSPRDKAPRRKSRGVADLSRAFAKAAGVDIPEQSARVGYSLRVEQAPNRESRVTLADEKDRFGQRKATLNWQLTEQDARSVRRTLELMAAELGAAMAGRARINFELSDPWRHTAGGAHHIGTTRMATDPKDGVVDGNCRVHGLDNLYVAGSSVFPTTSHANPTLTIVALALRLANHLANPT